VNAIKIGKYALLFFVLKKCLVLALVITALPELRKYGLNEWHCIAALSAVSVTTLLAIIYWKRRKRALVILRR